MFVSLNGKKPLGTKTLNALQRFLRERGNNRNESLNSIVLSVWPTIFSLTLIEINLPLNNNGSTLPNWSKCFNKKIPSNPDKLCA